MKTVKHEDTLYIYPFINENFPDEDLWPSLSLVTAVKDTNNENYIYININRFNLKESEIWKIRAAINKAQEFFDE